MAGYAAVVWTTGDVITETKLDNMVSNDQSEDAHAANGMIMNNTVPYQIKDFGGTNQPVISLPADDILRLHQIEVQEIAANSTVEDVMIQTGWSWADGVAAATLTKAITLPTAVDEDETFSILIQSLGTYVGVATKISNFTVSNSRSTTRALVVAAGGNVTGFTAQLRNNDDSNFSVGTDYGFSWMVIGRKA